MHTIPLPQVPKVKELSKEKGIFEIEGCFPGFGITIGNAIRRVLLSSLEGAAITNVKIKGVSHEFSTVPYAMEDVIQIILNLKKVRFIAHKDGQFRAKIEVKGEGVVKAKDIKAGSSLEVVNGEQVIATLTDKRADFEMSLMIEKGIGYQMSEERERKDKEIGVIEIDSIYSPVTRVNLEVENMRVGKRTDFERLILTIETDGTISPEEALSRVNATLVSQFSQLTSLKNIKAVESGKPVFSEEEAVEVEKEVGEELPTGVKDKKGLKIEGVNVLELPIQKLKIPARTSNSLIEQNFKNIGDLAVLSEEEILQIEGMGEKGLRDIKKALGNYGLILENEEDKELDRKKKKKK